MKFIDFIMQMSVKKDQDGNEIFFPWGILGTGRVINAPTKKDEIKKFLRSYYIGMLLIITPWLCIIHPYLLAVSNQLWIDLLIVAGLIILSLAWFYFGIKPIIQNLPQSPLKMKYRDNVKATGKFIHPILIVLLGLGSLLFVISGFCLLSAGETIIGLSVIIFFGFCSIVYGYMLFLRFKKDDDNNSTETR